jgi:hypothetical protein
MVLNVDSIHKDNFLLTYDPEINFVQLFQNKLFELHEQFKSLFPELIRI